MSATTSGQNQDVSAAIDSVQDYIDTLQTALVQAANAGRNDIATEIESRFLDANALEEKLVGLLTITAVDSLKAAIASCQQTTKVLDQQKTQIDAAVKAVDTAATVLDDIAEIVAAVGKLAK
jgi:hypothetical protein